MSHIPTMCESVIVCEGMGMCDDKISHSVVIVCVCVCVCVCVSHVMKFRGHVSHGSTPRSQYRNVCVCVCVLTSVDTHASLC